MNFNYLDNERFRLDVVQSKILFFKYSSEIFLNSPGN